MGIPVQIEVDAAEATHVSGMINIYIFAWQMSFILCMRHAPFYHFTALLLLLAGAMQFFLHAFLYFLSCYFCSFLAKANL